MFTKIKNKNYIGFDEEDKYVGFCEHVSETEEEDLHLFDKVEIYVDGEIEILGGSFMYPHYPGTATYVGETTDGFTDIEFTPKKGDPIFHQDVILSHDDGTTQTITYESSQTLRMICGNLTSGTNFDEYDKCPAVNHWLAKGTIEGVSEELHFYAEDTQMLIDVAEYYSLPIPYTGSLDNSMRMKSLDVNKEGAGNFLGVVVASIVFEDNVATKFRLYKTNRFEDYLNQK